jgi:alpha-1,2-mannosyltransferase
VLCLSVGTVAFLARLLPVLSSGGLFAINTYDAAVYFGSAVALTSGQLPYRDFLLLHPPGSTVAFAPFAALGLVVGESDAWALARLAVMALGSLTAILIARLLRPLGLPAAALGGLCYALLLPAVTIEVTTRLEPLAAACLVGALLLVSVDQPRTALRAPAVLVAGGLLGFAAVVKIWGVVPLVVVIAYLAIAAGLRRAAWAAAAAAAVGSLICLPFLLAAPAAMWRQVVSDQFGRDPSNIAFVDRLAEVLGLGLVAARGDALPPAAAAVLVVLGLIGTGIAAVLAFGTAQGRLAVILLVAFVVLLLSTATWFPHYAGVSAGVLAVTLGAGLSQVIRRLRTAPLRGLALALSGLLLVGSAVQLTQARFGDRFPAQALTRATAELPGCITADDPGALLGMNTVRRNISRSCRLVLDPGGYSYDFRPQVVRGRDPRWQRFFLDYMGSGTATMKTRYHTGFGLTRPTARTYRTWPVIVEIGGYELRRPVG